MLLAKKYYRKLLTTGLGASILRLLVKKTNGVKKMKSWTKLLPFFVVSWYAKKNLQKRIIKSGNHEITVVSPYKGVYIEVKK